MPKKEPKKPEDFIVPLNINGLQGRMLKLPAKTKGQREILFIYGQHSSLERWFGLALALNEIGAVTMPDLPGLGGMTSLYKIGRDGSIDQLADYLAAFIKLRYRNKKITIFGMSLGFVVVTRMLQRYPDLTKKVDGLVSVVGFAHKDDFIFSKSRYLAYRLGSLFFSRKYPALFFRLVFLQPVYLKLVYAHSFNAKEKFVNISGDEFKRTMDMEIHLWKVNDLRTQMKTAHEMLTLDNTKVRVNLPLYQVASKKDRYLNNISAEQHLRMIYNDFKIFYTRDPNHAPTVIADAKAAAPFVPADLRRLLKQEVAKKLKV